MFRQLYLWERNPIHLHGQKTSWAKTASLDVVMTTEKAPPLLQCMSSIQNQPHYRPTTSVRNLLKAYTNEDIKA
jgi:hypothetical protein